MTLSPRSRRGPPAGGPAGRPRLGSHGQAVLEACVWLSLIGSVALLTALGYRAEYRLYRKELEARSGWPGPNASAR
jgi:hypothetical protein